MDEVKIRKAFRKIKRDIGVLHQKIDLLSENLLKINEKIAKISENAQKRNSTKNHENQTNFYDTSTNHYSFKPLKPQNLPISTGNKGASTDRQTDRHTNTHPFISYEKTQKMQKNDDFSDFSHSVDQAADILGSLDNIKKEIRLQFKRLTNQEVLIFSTIYMLEEETGHADYKTLSEKLGLSESSIRDYVGRIIKKGIPVEKKKIKNKKVQLSISPNLKKLATLSTILQLRDI